MIGLTVLQLIPGRDIATERSLTSPIQNKIFDFAEVMRNIVYVIADSDSKDCVIVDAVCITCIFGSCFSLLFCFGDKSGRRKRN